MGKNSLFERHLLVSTKNLGVWEDSEKPKIEKRFGCGKSFTSDIYRTIESPDDEPTCAGCSAAWGKMKLKARPDLRIEVEETNPNGAWRSLYRAYLGDDLVGFVGVFYGWGKPWSLRPIGFREDKAEPDREIKTYYSKYAALLAVPGHLAEGRLKTEAAARREKAEIRERLLADRAKREAARRESDAELNLSIETLEGLIKDSSRLTNLERSAVVDAIRIMKASRNST